MVKEILIPQENIAKIEEVREIENKDLEQKPITESVKEAIIPTIHASSDDDAKEGLKELHSGGIIGSGAAVGTATLNPAAGATVSGTAAGIFKGLGKIEKGLGKITNSEGLKEFGEVHDEGATRAIEKISEK
jgi:hypothetical protein